MNIICNICFRMNLSLFFFLFVVIYVVQLKIKIRIFDFFTDDIFENIMEHRQGSEEVLNTYGFFVSPEELK
jgi:hypothetical protein